MKSIFKLIIVLVTVCVHNQATAQTTYRDIVQDNILSARDSARLVHYLVGMGMIEGKGEFVTKRKVYLDSALSIATWSAPLWFEKSYPLFFAGKYEIGIPYMDSAVKYNNKYLGYKGYLQCIFQKHYSEALADLKEAQRVNGEGHVEDHSYEFYIGLCYLQLDKFDSSEQVFRHLIDRTKEDHGWQMVHYLDWYYLGISLFEKDDYGKAIACFDTCLKRYTFFSDAKFYKAWCLKELHQMDLAYNLMAEANVDFAAGYTINDDNARYESYPYQVNKYQLKNSLEILDKKRKPTTQN
jgi:tetratricopeptide (TPR) repeat protein